MEFQPIETNVPDLNENIYTEQQDAVRYRELMVGVSTGDVYNRDLLEQRLRFDRNRTDFSAFYMDQGYAFFRVEASETRVEDGKVDLEIRIFEGIQATVGKVYITGNIKTNDHVLMREIRTRPGDVFSRAAIIRSQMALAQLAFHFS